MTQATTLRETANKLRTKMWRTAGARLNCQRRMKYRNTFSAFTIALLSVYLIAIAVYQKIFNVGQLNPSFDNQLTFISIVGAVFIIVLSLIEWANDFSVRANHLFENATEIKKLHARLERALIDSTPDAQLHAEFIEISLDYEALTDKNSPNHDPVDDFLFRAQNPTEPHPSFKMNFFLSCWAQVWWLIVTYWLYIAVLTVPIAAILVLK